MGHLSRQISVALALHGTAERVFFSLSRAVPVINTCGFRGEYCPSRERGWMPSVRWQEYLRERLRAFVAETGVDTIVFDGVVPYNGLLRARAELPDVRFAWMRRGFWQPGVSTSPLRSASIFDLVLEPGDIAADGDHGPTAGLLDAVRIPPIALTEHVPPLPRADAAAALGLNPDRPTALVTLSSGALNDVAKPRQAAVNAILENPEWQVAVTRSALADNGVSLTDESRCVELNGIYPLVKYLTAFDATVAAGGYNSVHELMYAGMPTLFVPNRSSATDDQVARTRWLASNELALFADEMSMVEITRQTARLLDDATRADLRSATSKLPAPTGSAKAADQLTKLVDVTPSGGRSWRLAEVRARSETARMLGPRGTAMVRRALGRGEDPGPDRPLQVTVVDDAAAEDTTTQGQPAELVFSDKLDSQLLRRDEPVEHVLAGSSDAYRAQRLEIIKQFYDVV